MQKKIIVILLLTFVSCRIKTPSLQEQEQLIADGAFPSGVPPWVVTASHPEIKRNNSGIIPHSFSNLTRNRQPNLRDDKPIIPENKERSDLETQIPTQAYDSSVKQLKSRQLSISPIQRINEVCSGIENAVSEAVITENSYERLQKYKNLVAKCNRSYDLWFWLGKEYLIEGDIQEAKHCFNQVLMLNREHKEAAGLLIQIREVETTFKSGKR